MKLITGLVLHISKKEFVFIMDKKKYKIGYTTGVYDMFHIGHLNILKKAKEQCDYLIVGVSTDEVVESYKHRRPIIPFQERIAIISELRCVDRAVPQTSMDKMEAWKELHFDALFHGSDWKGTDMYNKMISDFAEVGVDVVFLPHTEGVSSTLLSEVLYTLKEEEES
jgi:glycerol-3-phosphate cytidylyltransferase